MTGQEFVGAMLQARRQASGASARATSLAAGLSDSVVGKIESGRQDPSLRVFALIARQLDLSDREIAFLVRLAATGTDQEKAGSDPSFSA